MKRKTNISPEDLEAPAALLTRCVVNQPLAREGIRCPIGTRRRLLLSRGARKRVGVVGIASGSSGPLWDVRGRHRSSTPSRPRGEGLSPGVTNHQKAPPRSPWTVGRLDGGWSPPGWDGSNDVAKRDSESCFLSQDCARRKSFPGAVASVLLLFLSPPVEWEIRERFMHCHEIIRRIIMNNRQRRLCSSLLGE